MVRLALTLGTALLFIACHNSNSPQGAANTPTEAIVFAVTPWETWTEAVEAQLEETPNEALSQFHLALASGPDGRAYDEYSDFRSVIEDGWWGDHPTITSRINEHSHAILSFHEAANAEAIPFPEMWHNDMSHIGSDGRVRNSCHPGLNRMEALFHLILAEARRLESEGNIDEAAHLALDTMKLAAHWPQRAHPFVLLMVQHGLEDAPRVLQSLVIHPNISDETLREVLGTVEEIEESRISHGEYVRFHFDKVMEHMRELHEDDEYRAEFMRRFSPDSRDIQIAARQSLRGGQPLNIAERESVTDHAMALKRANEVVLANFEEFIVEAPIVIDSLAAHFSLPFHEQPEMTPEWIENLTDYDIWVFNIFDLTGEVFVFRRQRSLLQQSAERQILVALCLDRLGEDASPIIDPFTGAPLLWSDSRVWSVGPDLIDQSGLVECEYGSATSPPGDLSAIRRSMLSHPPEPTRAFDLYPADPMSYEEAGRSTYF